MKNHNELYQSVLLDLKNGRNSCVTTIFKGLEGTISDRIKRKADCNTDEISNVLSSGIPCFTQENETYVLQEPFYKEERLIILGGGHIALPLVEFASRLGFHIVVVDDRLSFANQGRFPLAHEVICDDFANALHQLEVNSSDYVIIITRGHRHDVHCLKAICKGEKPSYLGMIGSKRRVTIIKDTLIEEGYDKDRINAIHTPIGLSIGAITPEEISISIMAEVIAHKRLGLKDKKTRNQSDMDYDLLDRLAFEEEAKTVVTVIETKGSTPRGAGAKMIVYRDGTIIGSIGGGCSEAAVLQTARAMIGSNTYKVIPVDLTGDGAEEEGMVCGGVMTVLLEDMS